MSSIDRALIASGVFATRFSREFSAMVSDRNFSSEYLARRCRTTAEEISAWKTGVSVPSVEAWEYLCRADRGFLSLYDAWLESSSSRHGALDPAPICVSVTDPVADVDVQDHAPGDAQGAPIPTSLHSPEGGDADALPDKIRPALADDRPALADALFLGHLAQERRRPPGESGSAELDDRLQVDYVCKIGRGRFIRLGLPVAMTRSEAERICAFIMTQVD